MNWIFLHFLHSVSFCPFLAPPFLVLSCPVLSCPSLPSPTLPYRPYPTLPHHILSCLIMSLTVLYSPFLLVMGVSSRALLGFNSKTPWLSDLAGQTSWHCTALHYSSLSDCGNIRAQHGTLFSDYKSCLSRFRETILFSPSLSLSFFISHSPSLPSSLTLSLSLSLSLSLLPSLTLSLLHPLHLDLRSVRRLDEVYYGLVEILRSSNSESTSPVPRLALNA